MVIMRKGKNVSTHTIDALCTILDCKVSDVMEYHRTETDAARQEKK